MIPAYLSKMKPSATLAINMLAGEMEKKGNRVIRLGFGQSPFPIPQTMLQAFQREAHRGEYTPVNGILELREVIAKYYSRRDGREVSAEDVVVAPGSKELLYLVQLACLDCETFIHTPSWVSYPAQVNMLNKVPTLLHSSFEDQWKITPKQLQLSLNSTPHLAHNLLILNYPNNPTGVSYTEQEFRAMQPVLAQNPNSVVVCDEIYEHMYFGDGKFPSLAKHLPDQCIISSGLSKAWGAGGWRLGYMIFPPTLSHIRKAVTALASETYSCASTPVQYAAIEAFRSIDDDGDDDTRSTTEESGPAEAQEYLLKAQAILRALGMHCTHILTEGSSSIRCHPPQGGFYIYPDFTLAAATAVAGGKGGEGGEGGSDAERGWRSAEELCERILQDTGVTLLPSNEFKSPSEGGQMQVRLCFIDFDGASALKHCPDPHSSLNTRPNASASTTSSPGLKPSDEFPPDSLTCSPVSGGNVSYLYKGIEIDASWLEKHCGKVLEGARRIRAWTDLQTHNK